MHRLLVGIAVSLAAVAAQPPSGALSRVKKAVSENLARLPNYTCEQVVERSARPARSRRAVNVDTIRLEVAFVGGKELYAWPGATKFEDKPIDEVVGGGAIGSGDFALHANAVFNSDAPVFGPLREELLDGRKTLRGDFRIARAHSLYMIKSEGKAYAAGYHGSFWADAQSLDLVGLYVEADDIPAEAEVAAAADTMSYGRVRIGDSDFVLPQSSELTMTDSAGNQSVNRTRFSGCRQYLGESVVRFGDEAPAAERVKDPIAMPFPAGVSFDISLKTALGGSGVAIGDPIAATLEGSIRRAGLVLVPKGAVFSGRIVRLERRLAPFGEYLVVGLQFTSAEFGNARAEFRGELEDIIAGSNKQYWVPYAANAGRREARNLALTPPRRPGEGIFCVRGRTLRLPAGFRMRWRTEQ